MYPMEPRTITKTSLTRFLFAASLLSLLASPLLAVVPAQSKGEFEALTRHFPELAQGRQVAPFATVAPRLPQRARWQAATTAGGTLYFDVHSGEAALVKELPQPWIPGAGNTLTRADVAAVLGRPVTEIDEAILTDLGARFLTANGARLNVPISELAPRPPRRVGEQLWVVTYEHRPGGVLVATSRLTLVIGHGNLILWGSEGLAPMTAPPAAGITSAEARATVERYVGWDAGRDRLVSAPRRLYLLVATGAGALDPGVAGRRHHAVWELMLERRGELGTWLVHVDAHSGEILTFADANRYAWVRGGVAPRTWNDREESRPLPWVDLGDGSFSSFEGLYAASAGRATASLDGALVTLRDHCGTPGSPRVDGQAAGHVDFGSGPPNAAGDADCRTNGVGLNGGEHNTHTARDAYYHISRIKEKGRRWLPEVPWLAAPHEVRVNLVDPTLANEGVCSAFWSPFGYNGFFREGPFNPEVRCFNTGEIAAILVHEAGHGLDYNDAQGPADRGTGEAYADVHALLEEHTSCLGEGFLDQNCGGFGLPCAACTGARDVDYRQHTDEEGTPWTEPFTPANFTGVFCPDDAFFPAGPCGKQVHCESLPATGAIWDLVNHALTERYDLATSWWIVERDWYLAMQIATSMFNCNLSTFASDGCAATSWFQAMLAADDDDGDLTNGTPHAGELYAAFADHAIACGTTEDAANRSSGSCPTLAAPSLTAVATTGGIELSWPAVPGAAGYSLLRNHGSCERGYLLHATLEPEVDGFFDAEVADHQPYSYRLVALGGEGGPHGSACNSPLSPCAKAEIHACPETIAAAPRLTSSEERKVEVHWAADGGCGGFNVYRQRGGCDSGEGFVPVATAAAGSSYVDEGVSGGLRWGYRIAPLDPTGSFEAGHSPCAEIVPRGACSEPPRFTPQLRAVDAMGFNCSVDLAWEAAEAVCPDQPLVYNLYRDTDDDFTPSPETLVASGLTTTSYQDVGMVPGAPYTYRVRAEALSGLGGGPAEGVEDANDERVSVLPSGPFGILLADDLEAGSGNWIIAAGPADTGTTTPWVLTTTDSQSPPTSFFVDNESHVKDQVIRTTEAFFIPAGTILRFWHRFHLELGHDGGVLEYSTDNDVTWWDILAADAPADGSGGNPTVPANEERFVSGGYNFGLSACCNTPLPERLAWSSDSEGWHQVVVDLADFVGREVRFRWRLGNDFSREEEGWWVDDIELLRANTCQPGNGLIFFDGFEAGTTFNWSAAFP